MLAFSRFLTAAFVGSLVVMGLILFLTTPPIHAEYFGTRGLAIDSALPPTMIPHFDPRQFTGDA